MVLHRSPARPARRGRGLLAAGLVAAVVLVPGTAWAEDDPALPTDVAATLDEAGGTDGGGDEAATTTTPSEPAFEVPPELVAAFGELAAQGGFSEDCVNGVVAALELIGNGLAALPAELEALVTDLVGAVQASIEAQEPGPLEEFLTGLQPSEEGSDEPPTPIGGDIVAGLELLATTLSEDCAPAPAAPTTPTPPAGGNRDAGHTPAYTPPHTPHAPAPPAAQPVVYPGYAPTGAERDAGGLPLAAVGAPLALTAGGAAWTGRRWRAARDGA